MSGELQEIKALLLGIRGAVTRLEDTEAIKKLIVSYARGCDVGNDPEKIGPLFAVDATWECEGFGLYEGRDRLAAGLKGIAGEKIWWSLHYMISPQIEIAPDGHTATAFWYLWESATIPHEDTGEAEPCWIGGTYDCDLVKTDGGWLFKRMHLRLNMASAAAEGWVRKRFPHGNANQPYFEDLKPGRYLWCSCGKSAKQPFCDAAHKGTADVPVRFEIAEKKLAVLCGCKRTLTPPYCDGTHLGLDLGAFPPVKS